MQKKILSGELKSGENLFGDLYERNILKLEEIRCQEKDNLLSSCNVLIISTCRNPKQQKETNWKQKFQKNKMKTSA